ncbi:hypothetical protein HUF15_11725 [Streptomyces samsunensis]|uniref:Uncharacterized protein n=4 Tax=Streptomyces TaxID=1883 RepID=A0ABX6W3M7_STRMQ|nr:MULTISPECIES: hypothetical protein [Streptomyces]MYU18694.1 hypothetical protein [Streptomyces sp. SID8361]AQA10947.1 hypothetical protein BV401_11150 [Streptomyces autolyticus]MCC4316667.1 hypothetical protein [Streptomyces malaysiensis]MCD9588887.1 hypothetical protein [Streptomyces sp. 8ZJF_21]MCM3810087.1 hypothetical protein [Streptomyces sp. DR7-3]
MRRIKLGISTAMGAAAMAAGALALAPTASAVDPTTATLTAECGTYGSGLATLTATQSGTSATITLSSGAIKAPIDVPAGSVNSTLTLSKNGSGTATFTGNANPAIPTGSDVTTGPLKGTVAAGDILEAKSLKLVIFGLITVNCTATSAQSPGPFTF